MSNYDDNNRAAIWGNDKKETPKHPDFRGQATVDGVEYWVSAWKRGPDDNPKAPALRMAFSPKDEQKRAQPEKPEPQGGDAYMDDIPFAQFMRGTVA